MEHLVENEIVEEEEDDDESADLEVAAVEAINNGRFSFCVFIPFRHKGLN